MLVSSGGKQAERKKMNKKEPTQRELEEFVHNNILNCQTYLVNEMLAKEFVNYDDIVNLYLTDEQLKENGYDNPEEAKNNGEDMQEIFEWWLCDDWILSKLEKQGEPILKTDFGSWWGRTCTGQMISLDGVIKGIYNNLEY